jgi:L-lactate dehydrogenase (cytochrome)
LLSLLAFYRSAADDELTNDWNHESFNKLRFRPRVFRDVKEVDTSTTILGHRSSTPFFIAPAALAKLATPDGELALSRAAAKAGIIQAVGFRNSFLFRKHLLTRFPFSQSSAAASYSYEDVGGTKAPGQVLFYQV